MKRNNSYSFDEHSFDEQLEALSTLKAVGKPLITGFFWFNGIALLSAILAFIQVIIIAQVLNPRLVGLVAVFYIIQGAIESFTVSGFDKAIIQRKEIKQEYIDTAFVTNFFRGIFLGAVVFFAAPWIVRILNASQAQYIVQVMALTFVLKGARNPGALFFRRYLTFYKHFIWMSSGAMVKFTCTVFLLYILKNEWAIVFGVISYELILVFLSYILINVRPFFRFNKTVFRNLFQYGKWVLLASIAAFIERQGSQVFTVKLLGEASLGILFLCLRIGHFPISVSQQLKNVLFSVFSRLQNSSEDIKNLYERSIGIVAFFIFPVTGFAIVFAKPFTQLFLKQAWTQVAEILGLIICAISIQSINSITISLFNAKGIPKFAFFNHFLQGFVIIFAIYPLIKLFGIHGVALLYVIFNTVSFLFCWGVINHYLHFNVRIFSILLFPFLWSALSAIAFYFIQLNFSIDSILLFCFISINYFALYFILALLTKIIIYKYKVFETFSFFSTIKLAKQSILKK